MIFSSSTDRVPRHTAPHINRRIHRRTERSIARVSTGGRSAAIRRLGELDREWDIERTLEATAATAVMMGSALGALKHRSYYLLPAVVGGFLLQHALQGWCPPLALFRRLGIRTAMEINYERQKLKEYLENTG